MPSDIEQALAAVETIENLTDRQAVYNEAGRLRDILQAIARQAAIGAAVERVEAIGGRLYCDGPDNPGWFVTIGKPFGYEADKHGASRESLPAALAAALEATR